MDSSGFIKSSLRSRRVHIGQPQKLAVAAVGPITKDFSDKTYPNVLSLNAIQTAVGGGEETFLMSGKVGQSFLSLIMFLLRAALLWVPM